MGERIEFTEGLTAVEKGVDVLKIHEFPAVLEVEENSRPNDKEWK